MKKNKDLTGHFIKLKINWVVYDPKMMFYHDTNGTFVNKDSVFFILSKSDKTCPYGGYEVYLAIDSNLEKKAILIDMRNKNYTQIIEIL